MTDRIYIFDTIHTLGERGRVTGKSCNVSYKEDNTQQHNSTTEHILLQTHTRLLSLFNLEPLSFRFRAPSLPLPPAKC